MCDEDKLKRDEEITITPIRAYSPCSARRDRGRSRSARSRWKYGPRDAETARDTALGGAAVTGSHTGHRTGDTTLHFAI